MPRLHQISASEDVMGSRSKGPYDNLVMVVRGDRCIFTNSRQKTGREFNPLPRPPKFLVCPCHRKCKKRHSD